jgi:hypothetical protein
MLSMHLGVEGFITYTWRFLGNFFYVMYDVDPYHKSHIHFYLFKMHWLEIHKNRTGYFLWLSKKESANKIQEEISKS